MKKVEILFTMMKGGSKVSVEKMVKSLNVKQGSIMCLISALRNDFGAEIETERDGRKVLTYQIMNADAVAPKIVGRGKSTVAKVKPVKAQKVAVAKTSAVVARKSKSDATPVPDADLEISEVSEAELADLRNQLGL